MKQRLWTCTIVLAFAPLSLGLTGCQSDAQTGGLLGAAVGSAAGAGIDHRDRGRGALIGAGVGAVGGYIVGNESDKNKAPRHRYDY
ncbi:MAG: glycine zipper domain-containing protein [Phycisphaeraceae bacterium]